MLKKFAVKFSEDVSGTHSEQNNEKQSKFKRNKSDNKRINKDRLERLEKEYQILENENKSKTATFKREAEQVKTQSKDMGKRVNSRLDKFISDRNK